MDQSKDTDSAKSHTKISPDQGNNSIHSNIVFNSTITEREEASATMAGSGTVQSQLGTPSSSSSTQARAPVLSPSRSIASIDSRGRARGGSILSARGRAASIKSERSAYSI